MQILISGRNFEITPAIKTKIEDELSHAVANKSLTITSARIVVEKIKFMFHATITLNAKGKDFATDVEDNDLYTAIDKGVDKIEAQINKAVDKMHDVHHKNVRIADVVKSE